MKDLKNMCKVVFGEKFNSIVEATDNLNRQLVAIYPFDGDKRLHGRISIFVVKYMYGENIPEGKIKVLLCSGRYDIDVTYVGSINELRSVLEDYADVIEDVAA